MPGASISGGNSSFPIDGGATYAYTLLSDTANDGAQGIAVPLGIRSSTCRVLVVEKDGAAADASDADFTVDQPPRGVVVLFR